MNSEMLADLEVFFMALADKTRLRLLNLMRDGEICVCFFTEVLEESQPKISRHLAYLRMANGCTIKLLNQQTKLPRIFCVKP
jgi:ArsR family transcriptional regulator, arsenate/arsenite/antimonite-responsive transcriptional repressor